MGADDRMEETGEPALWIDVGELRRLLLTEAVLARLCCLVKIAVRAGFVSRHVVLFAYKIFN
jgi:hypothetical protein